jgi:hypothetical protein
MFVVDSVAFVSRLLSSVYAERIEPPAAGVQPVLVRGSVGLFLVRDDGANGTKLAKEVVSSFQYWNARTAHHFDGIFLGWGYDGVPAYVDGDFHRCVQELEEQLDWRYEGGSQLLLVDFVYDPSERLGHLDFSSTVPLDLSKLLDEKKYAQLAPLIEEVVRPLRDTPDDDGQSPTWWVSDYIAVLRTRKFVWQELLKRVGALLGWADDVANFAVRDLRRKGEARERAPGDA